MSEVLTIPGTEGSSTNGDTLGTLHFGAGCLYMHEYPSNHVGTQLDWDLTRYCVKLDTAPCKGTTWQGDWRHGARSAHNGGVNMMMVDTSVRFVSDDINLDTWKALSTPRGGEVTDSDI